jgi:hypothetical protein
VRREATRVFVCASDWHLTSKPMGDWFGSGAKFAGGGQVDIQFRLVLDDDAVAVLPVCDTGAIVRGAH